MEQYLNQMIAIVERKRKILEDECHLLRELLKPWSKSRPSLPDKTEVKQSSVEQRSEENLTEEEKAACQKVEELLGRAERLRQKSKVHHPKASPDFREEKERPLSDDISSIEETRPSSNDKMTSQSGNHPKSRMAFNKNNTANIKMTSHLEKRVGQNDSRGKQMQNLGKNSTKASSEKAGHDGVATSSRPQSGKGLLRPISAKSRHTPVHLLAPFKTDAKIRIPRRRASNEVKTRFHTNTSSAATARHVRESPFLTLPSIAQDFDCRNSHCDGQEGERVDGQHEQVGEAAGKVIQEGNNEVSFEQVSSGREECLSPLSAALSTVRLEPQHQVTELPTAEEERIVEEDGFLLQRDGTKLKLPAKLTKLVAMNNSLKDKCLASRLVKKVSVADPAQQFVDKLEAQMHIGEEMLHRVRALTSLRAHHILLDTLQALSLENISDDATYSQIYRAKRTLEFVLTAFSELHEETTYISNVQFRENKEMPDTPVLFRPESQTKWLMGQREKGNAEHKLLHVCNYLASCPHWAHLEFEQQYLQLQQCIAALTECEWWRHLSTSAGTGDASLFQAVFGLMTTCGQHQPALIQNPDFEDNSV